MKISTTKLRQIIKEEISHLREEDDTGEGSTRLVGRVPVETRTQRPADWDKTQEVDVAAAIKREQESPVATTFREEAQRLFNIFFAGYDDDALEIMVHSDPELEEILAKLYGWNLDLFPHDVQPSPTIVKIAQDFEKENKGIIDNEDEFLSRVEQELYTTGIDRFRQSKANPPEAARNVKAGQATIPGTTQHSQLQDLFKIAKPRPPRS